MQKQPFSLLVFHGSNRQKANSEAFKFLKTLESKCKNSHFGCCFLRGCEPSISQALIKAGENGEEYIQIIPLFILPGSHINEDIPSEIKTFSEQNPAIKITVKPCLCQCPEFSDMIAEQIKIAL